MHVHFEQNTCTRTQSTSYLSLSWMGKVPEDLPEAGGGWKLNRAQYYVEGWLASGNTRGIVGVTFSTSHCHRHDAPPRSNFNLRGHRSEIMLVRWNEPYQKLATCDIRGVIFVWAKHEGRWTIELINDRNSQVTDFAWSHDGRMALICYRDGFILVGSVSGQRYWSSMLHLDNTTIACGLWSPDDQQVMFGTLDGQVIVMSSTGSVVTQLPIHEGHEITGMAWSCERFNMEESESSREQSDTVTSLFIPQGLNQVSQSNTFLQSVSNMEKSTLMSNYDDPSPIIINTGLTDVKMDWSNCGEYLAVGGFIRQANLDCRNEIRFYAKDGTLVHWVPIPSQGKPLSAMTWGHNDKRLFVAAGCYMYVAWVSKQVAPLNFLCQRVIHQSVKSHKAVEKLPIPQRLKCGVKALYSPTIKSYIPEPLHLREFVCWPPPGGERLFCTMLRHGEETSGGHYTLYLEYLGGLVPLLKGKRASKLRPDFIIFDPKIKSSGKCCDQNQSGNAIESDSSSESDAGVYTDGCGSPRMQRRRRHKVFRAEKVNRSITFRTLDELMFDDNLPENNRLVEVTSNIWGTKFQITGVGSCLPACLGQIVYKTSLLHLQPRQMTITISEINPSRPMLTRDPNFTPAPISDDEDSFWTNEGEFLVERTVEAAVHDTPVIPYGKDSPPNYGMPIGDPIYVNRSSTGSSPLMENSQDVTASPGKITNTSGPVRLRSLSPVRNSLSQSSPVHKPDVQTGSNRQESGTAWQGARPKTNNKPQNQNNSGTPNNSPKSTATRCNGNATTTTCSPKLNHVGNHKCAALSNSNSSQSMPNNPTTNQYANANGLSSAQPGSNKIEAYPFIHSSGGKKVELIGGFKRLELNNLVDKGGGGGGGVGGGGGGGVGGIGEQVTAVNSVWKQETTTTSVPSKISPDDSVKGDDNKNNIAIRTNSVIAESVRSPVRPTEPRGTSRWADPAPQSVKLLDDDGPDSAELPFESNLVGDCSSPTAPLSLDLQRRLYLAHQHIIDTGAPISPTNCPSCLPAQRSTLTTPTSLPGSSETPDGTHHAIPQPPFCLANTSAINRVSLNNSERPSDFSKDSILQKPLYNISPLNFSGSEECKERKSGAASRNADNAAITATTTTNTCLLDKDASFVSKSKDGDARLDSDTLLIPWSPSSSLTSSTSSSLSSSSSSRKSSKDEIDSCHRDTKSSHHPQPPHSFTTTTTTTTKTKTTSVSASESASATAATPTALPPPSMHQSISTSSTPGRSFFQAASPTMAASPTPNHSKSLPSDRTSSEQLAHLLSEDPSHQNSSRNIQSMPGFVMRNPFTQTSETDDSVHTSPERPERRSSHQDHMSYQTSYDYSLSKGEDPYDMPSNIQDFDIHQISASLPTSPIRFGMRKDQTDENFINGKCKHLSPLLQRRGRNGQCGTQDIYMSMDLPHGYQSLEAFQKAQMRQKMSRRSLRPYSRFGQGRTFIMHNKAPLWNETSQVYQLDFGGRVTQESAKNFQIELRGKQVMQFGRIDNNAYTLDFQYPFTAVQAFAVALANVTQRLK